MAEFILDKRSHISDRRKNALDRREWVVSLDNTVSALKGKIVDRRCNTFDRRGTAIDRRGSLSGPRGNHLYLVHDLSTFCRHLPEEEYWIKLGVHDDLLSAMEKALQYTAKAYPCDSCLSNREQLHFRSMSETAYFK
ncbi:MAG: hypothetical protein R3F41_07830 [Gammaproteobacteria bacterium]|nr:hypothetical protein [Pseudomonadales bacterium]MCP5349268.1 hypothetical protein [Pseudomonadales bacterium]